MRECERENKSCPGFEAQCQISITYSFHPDNLCVCKCVCVHVCHSLPETSLLGDVTEFAFSFILI